MKLIRTPDEHYFEGGCVKFSTSRKDGELYYEVMQWNEDKTLLTTVDHGKVKDEVQLKELQSKDMEI